MRVRTADLVVHPAGQDRFLVGPRAGGRPQVLSAADLELLRSCAVLRRMRDHARAWATRPEVPAGSRKLARRALRRWLDQGLLVPFPTLCADPAPAPLLVRVDGDPADHGGRVLRVDPRATAQAVQGPDATGGILLTSDPDPRRYAFPADLPPGRPLDAVLEALDRVLGQPAHHLLREATPDAPWWTSVGPGLLARLGDGSPRVVAACLGTAGSLPEPADHLLRLPPVSQAAAREDWSRVRTGDRLIRHAPGTVLAPPDRIDPLVVAVDARGTVPPLAPIAGAWALFGATLRRVRPDALVAHLPWAVLHTGPPPARGAVAAHATWRVADVLIDTVRAPRMDRSLPPARRLARLGREVEAQADLRHLDAVLATRWRERCARRARDLHARAEGASDPWASDARRALGTLHDALLAEPPVPTDLQAGTWPEAVQALRVHLREHAARMVARGRSPRNR